VMVLVFPNFSSMQEALPVSQYASELWVCVTMATSSHCAPNQASRCECSTIKTSKIYNQDPQALQSKPPSSTIKPSNKQPLCSSATQVPAVPLAIPIRQPIKQHHRQLPHRQVLQQLSKQTLRVIYATTTVTSIKRYLTSP